MIKSWSDILDAHSPLLLPSAHDALTARLIRRAGFPAYQIGGLALEVTRAGVPDVDLVRPGEMIPWVSEIIRAVDLPVLIDASNGGGDIKGVARTVRDLETAGASAVFLEDQASPKRCGHMSGKHVLPLPQAVERLRVACDSLCRRTTFLLARTDAYAVEGFDGVMRRGVAYLDAGADGLYVEGVDNHAALAKIGREFSGRRLALSLLEGGGKTPWLTRDEVRDLGFSMILYPTSLLFRTIRATQRALDDLKAGLPMGAEGVQMDEFMRVVDMGYWQAIEEREP